MKIDSQDVSQADKLNGIEWSGSIGFFCKASRDAWGQYSPGNYFAGRWSEWKNRNNIFHCELIKKKGKWLIKSLYNDIHEKFYSETEIETVIEEIKNTRQRHGQIDCKDLPSAQS